MNRRTTYASRFAMFAVLLLGLAYAAPSQAALGIWTGRYSVTCNVSGSAPCTACDALMLIANSIDFLTALSLTISGVMIAYGGVRFMLSSGSSSSVSAAKQAIIAAVIGIAITLAAWVIVNSVLTLLGGEDYSLTNPIQCTN
jgi:hypothetical protein